MIITLCGSTRFKNEFEMANKTLTMQGHIVLAPGVFHHADGDELTTEDKIRLDNLHKQKINMSDAIFVINQDGYIGESTFGEIDWAQRMDKKIFFLIDPEKENNDTTAPDVEPVVNSEEEEA